MNYTQDRERERECSRPFPNTAEILPHVRGLVSYMLKMSMESFFFFNLAWIEKGGERNPCHIERHLHYSHSGKVICFIKLRLVKSGGGGRYCFICSLYFTFKTNCGAADNNKRFPIIPSQSVLWKGTESECSSFFLLAAATA